MKMITDITNYLHAHYTFHRGEANCGLIHYIPKGFKLVPELPSSRFLTYMRMPFYIFDDLVPHGIIPEVIPNNFAQIQVQNLTTAIQGKTGGIEPAHRLLGVVKPDHIPPGFAFVPVSADSSLLEKCHVLNHFYYKVIDAYRVLGISTPPRLLGIAVAARYVGRHTLVPPPKSRKHPLWTNDATKEDLSE